MRHSLPTTLLAALLAAFSLACDRQKPQNPAPPTDESAGETEQAEKPAKPAESPAPEDSDSRHAHWKAHDLHTHLDQYAAPIVGQLFEQNRIYRAVNLSGGSTPEAWRALLTRYGRMTDGTRRVAHFMNVDWENVDDEDFGEQMAERLREAVSMGYAGLKISKQLGLGVKTEDGEYLPVDTPKLDPLWEAAGELGVPVTIHTGDPKAFFEEPGPDNERWQELKRAPSWSFHGEEYPSRTSLLAARDRLLARHPDTTFILAHFGNNPEDLDYVEGVLEEHPNALLDTSARIAEFGRHPAERVREFFIKFQDRILFGTDLGVRARPSPDGQSLRYSLFLGSISRDTPSLKDVEPFYEKHWRYFESDAEAIAHPIPIQGDWKVHPIALRKAVRNKVYWKNAERRIFAPWLGRTRAKEVLDRAEHLVSR